MSPSQTAALNPTHVEDDSILDFNDVSPTFPSRLRLQVACEQADRGARLVRLLNEALDDGRT